MSRFRRGLYSTADFETDLEGVIVEVVAMLAGNEMLQESNLEVSLVTRQPRTLA